MSRCYPFLPPGPGYAAKYSNHESLILSIKLQQEKDRAISDKGAEKLVPQKLKSSKKRKDKEHRKREKKDKGEKKKEKKERKRDKVKASVLVDNRKHGDVGLLPKAGNVAFESKGKIQGSFSELLERSSVTEEHGLPIGSQNTSYSSDSTGNSGKRKRFAASPSGIQSIGNVIRIRLSSSQNRDEPSTSDSKEEEGAPTVNTVSQGHFLPGFTVVKPNPLVKSKDVITKSVALPHTSSTSTTTLHLVSTVDDVSHLTEKTTGSISQTEKVSSYHKKMLKKESLLKKLFVDWVAPPLERTLVVDEIEDNEEWLFGKKGEDRSAKKLRVSEECQSIGDNLSCSASAVMQPRAQLLVDVGLLWIR